MKLSGEATLQASVEEVYAALNDPAVLVRTIPGCRRLEQVGPDAYKATVAAGVASIKGTFDGDVRLTDQEPPRTFTLHASGAGAPGTVSAVATVTLEPTDTGATRLRYDADATIGGVIGGVGQRMITGVARKTAAEFFANVDRALSSPAPAPAAPGLRSEATREGTALRGAGAPASAASAASSARREDAALRGAEARASAASASSSVWTPPAPPFDPTRQRMRDLLMGAAFGAAIALIGVIVGAIVAGW